MKSKHSFFIPLLGVILMTLTNCGTDPEITQAHQSQNPVNYQASEEISPSERLEKMIRNLDSTEYSPETRQKIIDYLKLTKDLTIVQAAALEHDEEILEKIETKEKGVPIPLSGALFLSSFLIGSLDMINSFGSYNTFRNLGRALEKSFEKKVIHQIEKASVATSPMGTSSQQRSLLKEMLLAEVEESRLKAARALEIEHKKLNDLFLERKKEYTKRAWDLFHGNHPSVSLRGKTTQVAEQLLKNFNVKIDAQQTARLARKRMKMNRLAKAHRRELKIKSLPYALVVGGSLAIMLVELNQSKEEVEKIQIHLTPEQIENLKIQIQDAKDLLMRAHLTVLHYEKLIRESQS